MAGRKHHLLGELLEISPYIKSPYFLALQCLQLTESWRWSLRSLPSLVPINSRRWITMDYEDPHTQLTTFYELVVIMGFQLGDLESVYMWLFPFSFVGKANECLISHPNKSLTIWKDVDEKNLQRFFQISHYIKAKFEISMFK